MNRKKTVNALALMTACSLVLTGCAGTMKKNPGASVSGNQILTFSQAMAELTDGLNELTRKKKNFGLLADEVQVVFSLEKTSTNALGLSFNANATESGSTTIESVSIEKASGSDSDAVSRVEKIMNAVTGDSSSTGDSSQEQTATNNSSDSTSNTSTNSTRTFDNEVKNVLTDALSGTLGAAFTAKYDRTVTGNGNNTIQITFKSVASQPTEKMKLLSRYGKLGCTAFFASVLGVDISNPKIADQLAEVVETQGLDCEGIEETDDSGSDDESNSTT